MKEIKHFAGNTSAEALVVEATILFPIIIMIFAALVLISIYLPQRAILQDATQSAATIIATEQSDTWVSFDENADYQRNNNPPNVYVATINGAMLNRAAGEDRATEIVTKIASKGFTSATGSIDVEYDVINYIIYQEIIVRATQTIPISQFGLGFIGFTGDLTITQEARAVVKNGDEFVRNINIAKDLVVWLDNKIGFSKSLKEALNFSGADVMRNLFGY